MANKLEHRKLDARPDTLDFRDRMYVPTLKEVPTTLPLEAYREAEVPILDQGREGACTGFGLATVANFLLRRREVVPDDVPVSPRMFYEMARRYDEWQGEDYEGSSARGAMKGWHRHGVCGEERWPYTGARKQTLTHERATDARTRPLGAYYRVNHKDIIAMHTALAEVGVLYATGLVHEGWNRVGAKGVIRFVEGSTGGHAFAIVAFDRRGFWLQNSWGDDWGYEGFALCSYDDWLVNGTDTWVARLGAPIDLLDYESSAVIQSGAAGQSEAYAFSEIRPHVISIGNDGLLRASGTYATSEKDVENIFVDDIPRLSEGWQQKRLLMYAHGGLVPEQSAIQRLVDYRTPLLENEVYPLAFVWKTDFWTTLTNILSDALRQRRPEGFLDAAKDFMLDRLDDALEPIARNVLGMAQWDEMKENGLAATTSSKGGARFSAQFLQHGSLADFEFHLVGHSAGAIFLAPFVQLLTSEGRIEDGPMAGKTGLGLTIKTCTLWAPAATVDLFDQTYMPAIEAGKIKQFTLVTLSDQAEQDDHCANIYHKSLLYLVSNAFEKRAHIPLFRAGEPIIGMEKFVRDHTRLKRAFRSKRSNWVLAPNSEPLGSPSSSGAQRHGGFDDDRATVRALLATILGEAVEGRVRIRRSESSQRARRIRLTDASRGVR